MNRHVKGLTCMLMMALLAASCNKSDNNSTPKRWTRVYDNITLGDDNNTTAGQLLNTRTGQVVKLGDAASIRSQLSLLYYVTYGDNAFLTAPANLDEADPYETGEGPMYNMPGAGIDFWNSAEKNGVEVYKSSMTGAEFEQMAGMGNWQDFDAAFRKFNSGDPDLAYKLEFALNPEGGDVYLIQINGSLRCIARVQAVSSSQTNGFIRLKIVMEGREDMSVSGKALMPAE